MLCPLPRLSWAASSSVGICEHHDNHHIMQGLRRRFATFWPPTFSRNGAPTVEVPPQQQSRAQNEDVATVTTTLPPRNARESRGRLPEPAGPRTLTANVEDGGVGDSGSRADAANEKGDYGDGEGESTTAVRVLELVHPWGSSDESPPANWSSRHYSPTTTTFRSTHKRGRRRGRDDDVFSDKTAADILQPTTALTTYVPPSSPAEDWGIEQHRLSVKRQRGLVGDGASTGCRGKFEQQTNGGGGDQQHCNPNPYRRRHTCPADSAFVSPMKRSARRALEDTHTNNGIATEEDVKLLTAQANEVDDNEEAHYARLFPPSHLTFRAGFFKALAHRRRAKEITKTAANKGKKGLSSSRFKRRTREIHALIVRHAFNAAHPSRDAAEGEAGDARATVEAAVAAAAARRSGIEGDAVWGRVNRNELEEEEEAERRAEARRGRLEMLRAENVAALGEARSARARLVNSAGAALDEAAGADMAKLRDVFAGEAPQAARFKGDAELARLQQEYVDLENLLTAIKVAHVADNTDELSKLLSMPAANRLHTQKEFKDAFEANRVRQDALAKASAEIAAADARAAAAAAAAKAETRSKQEAEQAEAQARAQAEKDRVQAERAARQARGKFIAEAEVLKAVVEGHRATTEQILQSSDPAVKKIRMEFKKSYQGCLNKLASTPDTVALVVNMIHVRAQEPLEEAARLGWGEQAKDFLYVNLAEKLVGYSEGDQFDAATYEMAFPLACVSVDLMAQHPGLSDLFLGTLYSKCPSAIPSLSFDTAGKSDEEVLQLFGMKEGEDLREFVGRTKGLVVLMAAVMQTPARLGQAAAHPLPLAAGWRWLARFVNGLAEYVGKGRPPPIPAGPVLEWFFKVAGYELQRRYGAAVDKIVQTTKNEVLPHLIPKSRVPHLLDVVIQDYENMGRRFIAPIGREKHFKQYRQWGDT